MQKMQEIGGGKFTLGRGLNIRRFYTRAEAHPFDEIEWDRRTARIVASDGKIIFEQNDVEFPKFWSQLATDIVAQKYFRGKLGSPEREYSVRQMIGRVAHTIADWGIRDGYFSSQEAAEVFRDELTYLLLHQMASLNSPIWFNVGFEPRPQCSACQPYHALVNTVYGPMPIGEIVEKNLIGLPVYDENGLTQVVAVKHNGRKQVYRVQLNDGFYVEATGDHLVCAHDVRRTQTIQWRRVDELQPGMVMRVYPHTSETITPPPAHLGIAEAALAGWLQADGFAGEYAEGTNRSLTIEFMTADEQEQDWVMSHLHAIFPDHHYKVRDVETQDKSLRCRRIRLYGEVLRPFVEKYELLKRGTEIRVPRVVWTASNEIVVAYLRSIFQAEGYATTHGNSGRVALAVISEDWAHDLQVLLTRLGVYSRLRRKEEKRDDRHDPFELDISILSERHQFEQRIGFLSKRKQVRLEESLDLSGKMCPDVRFAEIVRIEPLGEMEVYDIQTVSGHYLTNSVLVHNCFILSVEDDMDSILEWYRTEGKIFQGGSGSGVNLSKLRSSKEPLSKGGKASGPVSFMRGADSIAGTIKSGGKTRRAAKMLVLNIDHPDIVEFIWCKAKEERKAYALADSGYDMSSLDSDGWISIQYQNANNSVRVTDEFMQAVIEDKEWPLRAITTGEVLETHPARELMHQIAEAAWECGDPGMQYDTTINDWHTCPNSGRINATNPCFTGDALVLTNKGFVPFRELIHRACEGEHFRIATDNITSGGKGIAFTTPACFMVTGYNPVYRLIFSNGMEVRCTKNHRFFTLNRGMVPADELTPEDRIAVCTSQIEFQETSPAFPISTQFEDYRQKLDWHQPINLPTHWRKEFAELLGHLIGDGGISGNIVTWTYGSAEEQKELVPRHTALLSEIMGQPEYTNTAQMENGTFQLRVSRAPFKRFLEALGVRDVKAAHKVVPFSLFQAPTLVVAAFLRGLFTADGCIVEQPNGTRYVGLSSKSKELLQGVQTLLSGFGIFSRIYASERNKEGLPYTRRDGTEGTYQSQGMSYDLRITGRSLREFHRHIDFAINTKSQKLRRILEHTEHYATDETVSLVAMEPDSVELTYNLTEPTNHSYIVNGLIVANCGEYNHLDDSACNLGSLNLMKFTRPDGEFDVEAFRHAVSVMILAQEIIVGNSSYPTPKITNNAIAFRELGLGYSNLGALLMSRGVPYDSDEGRAYAAAMTALMTGQAYLTSAKIAERMGSFAGYAINREPMLRVIKKHRDSLDKIDSTLVPQDVMEAATYVWDEALHLGEIHGYRNSQVTVIAPTGTISFAMDCDTTGIEPDIALVKYKKLVGGGELKMVNQTVPRALRRLGYDIDQIAEIMSHLEQHGTIEGSPHLKEEHLPVFDCAFRPLNGQRSIHYTGHLKMMAATQPFISGAISKTVNLSHDVTPDDIAQVYIEGWKQGLKALAIYRDGSKRVQPLSTAKREEKVKGQGREARSQRLEEQPATSDQRLATQEYAPVRHRLPDTRQAITHHFTIKSQDGSVHDGYITVGMYEDGSPGEIFVTVAKEGSTTSGLMDALATAVSIALQYGVPLEALVKKFSHMRFEPSGVTTNPEIRVAKSLVDYIFRWLASRFLDTEAQAQLGVMTPKVRARLTAELDKMPEEPSLPPVVPTAHQHTYVSQADAPACPDCGAIMVRNGTCYRCFNCGSTSGCS